MNRTNRPWMVATTLAAVLAACGSNEEPTVNASNTATTGGATTGGQNSSNTGGISNTGGADATGAQSGVAGGSADPGTGGIQEGTGGQDIASGGAPLPGSGGDGGGGTGGAETTGSGGAISIKFCVGSCSAPSDCVVGTGTAITDADNYSCEAGGCRYLGCLSDAECDSIISGQLCREGACVPPCTAPADCSLGSTAYDADNYQCQDGACEYTGCNSDTECQESLTADYSCVASEGGVPVCQTDIGLTCTTPSDCVSEGAFDAYDEDNYDCVDSKCMYLGCQDDAECNDGATVPSVCGGG